MWSAPQRNDGMEDFGRGQSSTFQKKKTTPDFFFSLFFPFPLTKYAWTAQTGGAPDKGGPLELQR